MPACPVVSFSHQILHFISECEGICPLNPVFRQPVSRPCSPGSRRASRSRSTNGQASVHAYHPWKTDPVCEQSTSSWCRAQQKGKCPDKGPEAEHRKAHNAS